LNRDIFLSNNQRPVQSFTKWLEDRIIAHDTIISNARKLQKQIDENHLSSISKEITTFNIDDLVLVDYPSDSLKSGPPNKLLTNKKGPMIVSDKTANDMFYTLKDLTNDKREEIVHVSRLHKYVNDQHIDARDIANRDQQLFDIDEVVAHRGNIRNISTLEFKVKWMPINDQLAEFTWEPYKYLKSTLALHKYLKDNKLKSLIPKEFK
jgi:ribosomal protein L21E